MNIMGSLAGVWLFDVLCWRSLPPPVWFGIAAVMLLGLIRVPRAWIAAVLVGAAATLVWWGGRSEFPTIWSPYHKLVLKPLEAGEGTNRVRQGYLLDANFANYQQLQDLSDAFLRAHPETFDAGQVRFGCYDLPLTIKPVIHRMLVVGAGAGNNAAGALRHGAEQIDCVDIDPEILELGRRFHPERPYDNPRVRLITEDARAFFKRALGRYDVIWFGWLDSHVLGTSFANLRLDNYVYTRESIHDARDLLTDEGVIILTMGAPLGGWNWIADRQATLLREAFGHEPIAYAEGGIPAKYGAGTGVTLICGRHLLGVADFPNPASRAFVADHQVRLPGTSRPTTDDWPYLYLERAGVPNLNWITTCLILGMVACVWRWKGRGERRPDWHFFWLGAAFLLLEVQTVSRATLLFGMTWQVNAIVISAVLVMILMANLVEANVPRLPGWVAAIGLAASLLALALVPLGQFNALSGGIKLLAASLFLTGPLFFGGLIFVRSWSRCADRSRALGSNLIGALLGGLLESLSYVVGVRALILLVGLFYVAALLSRQSGAERGEAKRVRETARQV